MQAASCFFCGGYARQPNANYSQKQQIPCKFTSIFTCQAFILKYSRRLSKYSSSKSSLVFTYLYFPFVFCRFSYYFQAQMMIFFCNDINKLHSIFRTILKYRISYCFYCTFYFYNELRESSFVLKQPLIDLISSLEPF